ncbi:copper homeostasis protein CutC [Devosia pacifica]|uniref:PF03932 family protein CutC n=1 Tax=Devosia pacifica TaxID=1335967 RepID=A0A918RZE2_9HYPH|nr:copper homeostasis protein CutC [Devosia pacifica]GHA18074.1 copper homeostasis protein CutC [Devosia pacifica]
MPGPVLEICVADNPSLEAAITGGANRIELCSALELGGLTPTPGLLRVAASSPIPVYAMVRPRSGDFVFSEADRAVMLAEIDAIAEAGLAGVVLGASLPDGSLDTETLGHLAERARAHQLGTTLHRAFDLVPDIAEAVEAASALGFERILTSGRAARAIDGVGDIALAHQCAQGRLAIMAGSGIAPDVVRAIRSRAPLDEWHASCGTSQPQSAAAVSLGFTAPERRSTEVESVKALRRALDALVR